ncbi:hypothetical protein Dimus_005576 [Dionaea muscipula]
MVERRRSSRLSPSLPSSSLDLGLDAVVGLPPIGEGVESIEVMAEDGDSSELKVSPSTATESEDGESTEAPVTSSKEEKLLDSEGKRLPTARAPILNPIFEIEDPILGSMTDSPAWEALSHSEEGLPDVRASDDVGVLPRASLGRTSPLSRSGADVEDGAGCETCLAPIQRSAMVKSLGDAVVSAIPVSSLSGGTPASRAQVNSFPCVLSSMMEEDGATGQDCGVVTGDGGQRVLVVSSVPGQGGSTSIVVQSEMETAGLAQAVTAEICTSSGQFSGYPPQMELHRDSPFPDGGTRPVVEGMLCGPNLPLSCGTVGQGDGASVSEEVRGAPVAREALRSQPTDGLRQPLSFPAMPESGVEAQPGEASRPAPAAQPVMTVRAPAGIQTTEMGTRMAGVGRTFLISLPPCLLTSVRDGFLLVNATPPACPPVMLLECRLLRLQHDRWPSSTPRLWVDVFDAETKLTDEDEDAGGVGFLVLEMVFYLGFSPELCVACSGFSDLVCCSATMPLTSFRVSSLQVASVVWWFPLPSCLRVVSMMRRLSLGIG